MTDYTIISNDFDDTRNNAKGYYKAHRMADRILVGHWFKDCFCSVSPDDESDRNSFMKVVDKNGNEDMEAHLVIKNELTDKEFTATIKFHALMAFTWTLTPTEDRDEYFVDRIWFKDISDVRITAEDYELTNDEKIMIMDMFTTYITDKEGFR